MSVCVLLYNFNKGKRWRTTRSVFLALAISLVVELTGMFSAHGQERGVISSIPQNLKSSHPAPISPPIPTPERTLKPTPTPTPTPSPKPEVRPLISAPYAYGALQVIVSIAPELTSSEGLLQRFYRDDSGNWVAEDPTPWPVMLGRHGLAWGRGIHDLPTDEPVPPDSIKSTGDLRSPMGLFKIGLALGYAPRLPQGAHGWPYHQVTDRDAWMDDPALPNYNHLYTLPEGAPKPSWWERERLTLGDPAYKWLLTIEHNYNGPQAMDGGTAIFFHIRRAEHYRTAGCTTMPKDDLENILTWLQPGSDAMLAQLTVAEYKKRWRQWGLPRPSLVGAMPHTLLPFWPEGE